MAVVLGDFSRVTPILRSGQGHLDGPHLLWVVGPDGLWGAAPLLILGQDPHITRAERSNNYMQFKL